MAGLKLGEILVKQKVVAPEKMALAFEEQKKTKLRLSNVLIQMGMVTDAQILRALSEFYKMQGIDLSSFEGNEEVTKMITRDFCEKNLIVPIQKAGDTLVVALSDPGNIFVLEDLKFITRSKIQPVVATEASVSAAIDRFYGQKMSDITRQVTEENLRDSEGMQIGGSHTETIDEVDEDQGPIIKFVNAVLAEAMRRKVSDIHFEPYEKKYRVRFRIDGNMIEYTTQNPSSGVSIASRIKIMAKLDISEKRRPQDGRIKIRLKDGKEMDFRVSILPTMWGEKVVLRLLDKSNLQLDMTKLGLEPDDLVVFKDCINLPQGLLLITGPTGSGKTTTIYSALAELNQPDINIATAEDPVEFNLEGINQVQMHNDIDLNFAAALRSFLRQDPDVIMVGEIRDLETAEISMKAASTGHMVVSTLHTNDAPATVARLIDMGVAPYVLTSTINLIVAQRLVGRICEACKVAVDVTPDVLIKLGVESKEVGDYHVYKGKGCSVCNNTGIKGRRAIFELMRMTPKMRDLILTGASQAELRITARLEGMRTLRRSALLKLKRGETTIEEVLNNSVKDT